MLTLLSSAVDVDGLTPTKRLPWLRNQGEKMREERGGKEEEKDGKVMNEIKQWQNIWRLSPDRWNTSQISWCPQVLIKIMEEHTRFPENCQTFGLIISPKSLSKQHHAGARVKTQRCSSVMQCSCKSESLKPNWNQIRLSASWSRMRYIEINTPRKSDWFSKLWNFVLNGIMMDYDIVWPSRAASRWQVVTCSRTVLSSLDQLLDGPFLTSSLPSQGHCEILLQTREVKPRWLDRTAACEAAPWISWGFECWKC